MVTCQSWCTTSIDPWTTFFLIYINDHSDNVVSTVKLFADDTSLFSVVEDSDISAYELNNDMQRISGLISEKCHSILI